MVDLISDSDLDDVPGVDATTEQKQYAARRASDTVLRYWQRDVSLAPQWVADMALDLAASYLRNPGGQSSVTRSVDDASRTDRWDGHRGHGASFFELTVDQIARLSPAVRARRVGSIRTRIPL